MGSRRSAVLALARETHQQVEDLQIDPDHGEDQAESRGPLVLLGIAQIHAVFDHGEIADQEEGGNHNADHVKGDGESGILQHGNHIGAGEGDHETDHGEKGDGDGTGKQGQQHGAINGNTDV